MTLDKEQLQSVEENPDNLAFSDKDPEYPPSGFLSWTKCLDSPLPIFISMPYFHLVENETKNSVIFESPVEPNLEPYFLVDPVRKMAFISDSVIHAFNFISNICNILLSKQHIVFLYCRRRGYWWEQISTIK